MYDKFIVYCERIKRQSNYSVRYSFNTQLNDRIKALPESERKFDNLKKYWILSTMGLFTLIQQYKNSNKIHFQFEPETKKIFIEQVKIKIEKEKEKQRRVVELNQNKKYWIKFKSTLENDYEKYSDLVHENLKDNIQLYPYQIAATIFSNEIRNVLLALEMGLGKTLCSIALCEMNKFKKVFVITPNSLKHNYYNEVEKFTNSKAHIVGWRKNKYTIDEAKYVIVNYEFFASNDSKRIDKKYSNLGIDKINALVLDECHRVKSTKTATYKNFKRIFSDKIFEDGKSCKVFMSGTPMTNRAEELYTVLHEISKLDFPTKKYFDEFYLGRKYDPNAEGYDRYTSDNNSDRFFQLYQSISPFVFRKKKTEVLKDLPEKTYQKLILELSSSEQSRYDDIESGVVEELFSSDRPNPLTVMLRLRQFSSSTKVKYIKDIVDEILLSGEKLVIIDMFKEVLYEINKLYPNISVVHTGDQSVEERAGMVKDFQDENSNIKIFLATVQTANYGLTLTAANKMLILTLPFTVGEYDQVSDRLHRIGQKNNVHIIPVIFQDTIDEYMYTLIERKRTEIMAVLDNEKYVSSINESTIHELLEYLRMKYGK